MENKEINEYLATNLFELKRGKDFDYWDNRFAEAGLGGNVPVKDYISNYHMVLEYISFKYGVHFHIAPPTDDSNIKTWAVQIQPYFGASRLALGESYMNLGEAVCRCAVNYLKTVKST